MSATAPGGTLCARSGNPWAGALAWTARGCCCVVEGAPTSGVHSMHTTMHRSPAHSAHADGSARP